jgi:hypothetical protein
MRFVRFAATFAVAVFVMGLWASSSQAVSRSLTGNARFQIGNGLPIPIVLNAPPTGDVLATPAAEVSATGPGGKNLKFINTGVMTHGGTKRTQGVFLANSAVFQVATALAVNFPKTAGTLSIGGRSGPAVVTWCPGTAVPVAGAPGCGVFPMGGAIPGGMRYTATGAQFGGPLAGDTTGLATVALFVGGPPPGIGTAINAFASPSGMGVIGAAFNSKLSTVAGVPGPASGVFVGSANVFGSFTNVLASGLGAGIGNGATSYGGPWTTGRLTVINTSASETFTRTGSDARTATHGLGAISLVSGGISARVLSGPNANRGWLNLVIGNSVPAVPPGALAAGAGLLALAGSFVLRRRQASSLV